MMITKAYSYLRFSTAEQSKGDSRRRQMQLAADFAERHGLDLQDVGYEDLGVSAYHSANADTGMLGEFREAVTLGAIPKGSWLLLESMDRLSRAKPRKAVRLLEEICDAGITVVTLADGRTYNMASLDDDPMAFMYAFMVAIRANEESVSKARRLRAAWGQKRKRGEEAVILTRLAPSWLRVVEGGATRSFEVIEDRADVVRRVFAMAAAGTGQHKIAETLNREGVPTVSHAKHWHKSIIAKWLKSPAVIGIFIPHTLDDSSSRKVRKPEKAIEGYFPAIVERHLFEAVNALHGGERKARTVHDGARGVVNLMAGLARCVHCGGTMTRVNKGSKAKAGKSYLVCAKAKAGAGCEYRAVDQEALETAMVSSGASIRLYASSTVVIDDELRLKAVELKASLAMFEDKLKKTTDELFNKPALVLRTALDNLAIDKERTESNLAELTRQLAAGGAELVTRNAGLAADALEASPFDVAKANAALRRVFDFAEISWWESAIILHWRHTKDRVLKVHLDVNTKQRKKRYAIPPPSPNLVD